MSITSNLATIAHQHGTLLFAPWPAAESIFDADTAEAIEFLRPLVGPTATVALYYLARRLHPPTLSIVCDVGELSHACGGGRNPLRRDSRVIKALARLERFGYLRHDGNGRCEVRTQIPPLAPGRIAKLPSELRYLLATYQQL
jgi:hypothetical protein